MSYLVNVKYIYKNLKIEFICISFRRYKINISLATVASPAGRIRLNKNN